MNDSHFLAGNSRAWKSFSSLDKGQSGEWEDQGHLTQNHGARLRNPLISTQGVREAEGVLGDRAKEEVRRASLWRRGEQRNGEHQLGHPGTRIHLHCPISTSLALAQVGGVRSGPRLRGDPPHPCHPPPCLLLPLRLRPQEYVQLEKRADLLQSKPFPKGKPGSRR